MIINACLYGKNIKIVAAIEWVVAKPKLLILSVHFRGFSSQFVAAYILSNWFVLFPTVAYKINYSLNAFSPCNNLRSICDVIFKPLDTHNFRSNETLLFRGCMYLVYFSSSSTLFRSINFFIILYAHIFFLFQPEKVKLLNFLSAFQCVYVHVCLSVSSYFLSFLVTVVLCMTHVAFRVLFDMVWYVMRLLCYMLLWAGVRGFEWSRTSIGGSRWLYHMGVQGAK